MTNLGRQPLEIVEIDLDKCQLVYGVGLCTAVLGTTGVRKCYNSRATCQVPAVYQSPEVGTATLFYAQGDTITAGDLVRDEDVFLSFDVDIPAAPAGVVCEIGNATTGVYIGFTGSEFVARAGHAGALPQTECASLRTPAADLAGRAGTIFVRITITGAVIAAWFWDITTRRIEAIGTATASAGAYPGGVWSALAPGGVGVVAFTFPTGEDGTAFNGAIGQARIRNSSLGPDMVDAAPLTLRFARNIGGLPKGTTIYPALVSASTLPAEINLGGIDRNIGSLGARAEGSFALDDFTDADFETDPYQAERVTGAAQTDEGGYNPAERGTFWAKLRARHPYVVGRALRHRMGYVGDTFSAFDAAPSSPSIISLLLESGDTLLLESDDKLLLESSGGADAGAGAGGGSTRTRNYVITNIDGPSGRGGVTVKARDELDLVEDEKAVCPKPSRGRLAADLAENVMAFELSGDATEYPASGFVSLGSEIMAFTRSGATFTLTGRGVYGSGQSSHSEGDTVQLCAAWLHKPIYEIARDLMVDFGGIDPATITYSDWQTKGDTWQAGYRLTRVIPKPVGVRTLLAELALFGCYWWVDVFARQVRFDVNRFLEIGETYTPLSADALEDAAHIANQSETVVRNEDQRISRIWLWHGILNMAGSVTDRANYARLRDAASLDAAAPDQYGQERLREFFTPWLGTSGNDSVAGPTVVRMLNRFTETPVTFTCSIDAKDAATIEMADLIKVFSRVMADETGKVRGEKMQVSYVEEEVAGHSLKIKAQSYRFEGRFGRIMENDANDYDTATDAEKELGFYIVDGSTLTFPDGSPPYLMF